MNIVSIKTILSSNPTHNSLGTVALNTWSSVLNHHPYPVVYIYMIKHLLNDTQIMV